MSQTSREHFWVPSILKDFGIVCSTHVPLFSDNKAATFIANNPIFHERTKHVEIDCHFIREAILVDKISTPCVPKEEKLVDVSTKALSRKQLEYICFNLSMIHIYML